MIDGGENPMAAWRKIKLFLKLLFLSIGAGLILFVLCGVVCVTWERNYYTSVSVSVLIDTTLADVPELNVKAKEEIDRWLKFAFDYFKKNFGVKFFVTTRLDLPFDRVYDFMEVRPKKEKLVIGFRNIAAANGHSHSDSFSVQINTVFTENRDQYPWILIHELCHQFNAIDLRETDSVMNGEQMLTQIRKGQDSELKTENKNRERNSPWFFSLDLQNREIIELSKKEYATTYHMLKDYPVAVIKEIVARYENLLPSAKFPGNVNVDIGYYYNRIQDYERSLTYYLKSIQLNQYEKEIENFNSQLVIGQDKKYEAILINCRMLNKWDDIILYAARIPDGGGSSPEKYRSLSCAYYSKGVIDLAIGYMKKYLDRKNEDEDMWLFLGCMYLKRVPLLVWMGSDIDRAIEAFTKAMELKPNDWRPYSYLYVIHLGNENKEKAAEYRKKLESMKYNVNSIVLTEEGYNGPEKKVN